METGSIDWTFHRYHRPLEFGCNVETEKIQEGIFQLEFALFVRCVLNQNTRLIIIIIISDKQK